MAMLGLASLSRPTGAQAGDSLTIVVVDTQKIYRESIALNQLENELDRERAAYLDRLGQKEKDLRVADRELAAQRTVLSPEEFGQRRKALEQQMFTLQRDLQDRKRAIDKHFAAGMTRLQAELSEIVREIAERRNADLVITKNAVVLVKPALEITEQALRKLNERLPRFDFPAEEN